jgi:hypothetical protein
MSFRALRILAVIVPLVAANSAQAVVTISAAPTSNFSCSAGTCTATAAAANLNVADLEGDVAASDVTVAVGNRRAQLEVDAALSWTSAHTLTLTAGRPIAVNAPVAVMGEGAVTITAPGNYYGKSLLFGPRGHITFADLKDKLIIQGQLYRLVGAIAALQADLNVDPGGRYALAQNYDASVDGTYTRSPIENFQAGLEGLGNKIANLSIAADSGSYCCQLGLFAQITQGFVYDLVLQNAHVAYTTTTGGAVGILAGENRGSVEGCYAKGWVHVTPVTGQSSYPFTAVGGLVGLNRFIIDTSVASVNVRSNVREAYIGGLTGANEGRIADSFATGPVTGGTNATIGGLVGLQDSPSPGIALEISYSSGAVSGPSSATIGGLVGYVTPSSAAIYSVYWDTTTSGTTQSAVGTGLTTTQLQSGLPAGFSSQTWTETPGAYNGLPYLRYVPQPTT